MNKKRLIFIPIFGIIIITYIIVFIPNFKLANVIDDREIREQLNYGNYKIVFSESKEYIFGEIYKKSISGWKMTHSSSPAVNDRHHTIKEHIFRISNISSISIDEQSYLYGYVNPNKVESIRFQTEDLDYRLKIKDYFWYLPVKENDLAFNNYQLSVILDNGEEVYYPFDEIE
ncbi:hypothetical protein [Alkalihalobacterium elongatum]|uniref:hypothetical protein n=1 Tax=Alkalihalobacterium elongatum TaxID=2675466 RepID=UPI001C1F2C97|nr:hypothetical protein [Alkalihalobacterium elongatum]